MGSALESRRFLKIISFLPSVFLRVISAGVPVLRLQPNKLRTSRVYLHRNLDNLPHCFPQESDSPFHRIAFGGLSCTALVIAGEHATGKLVALRGRRQRHRSPTHYGNKSCWAEKVTEPTSGTASPSVPRLACDSARLAFSCTLLSSPGVLMTALEALGDGIGKMRHRLLRTIVYCFSFFRC